MEENINFFDAFESDIEAEKNGIEVDINGGVTVTVKSSNIDVNDSLKNAMTKEFNRSGKSYRNTLEYFAKEKNLNKIKSIFAEHVLINWSGMKDRNNIEIPYSKEKAFELFCNKKMHNFWKLIQEISSNAEVFKVHNHTEMKDELKKI